MLDVDRLRVFGEVARRGSFTAAARVLSFTQPAVSHHVKQLEREIGVTLIERSPRGIRLTPAGRKLAEHADALLTHLDDIESDILEIAGQGGCALRVVAFPTAAATLVPRAVAAFRGRMPDVKLELAEADPPVSLPALAAAEWDIALAYDYPVLQTRYDPALAWEQLLADDMAACLPAGHPVAGEAEIDLRSLAGETFVAPYDCICREALEHACRRAGFGLKVDSDTNDYMAMQGLVAAGVGVAVIPRLVASIAVRDEVVMRPLVAGALTRTVSIVSRREGFQSVAGATMRALLREVADGLTTGPLPLAAPLAATAAAA